MKFFGKGSKITINGKTYTGNNITVNGGQVYVDGNLQDELDETKKVEITVLSGVDKIVSDKEIHIKGDVHGNVESKVTVNCDNVYGDVNAGVTVNCDDIKGNATAGVTIPSIFVADSLNILKASCDLT